MLDARQLDTPSIVKILCSHWVAQDLHPDVIKAKLRAFDAVGGHHASRESIERFLARYRNPHTRKLYLSHLRSTFKLLVMLEVIDKDPTIWVGAIRTPRRLPKPLSALELDLVIAEGQGRAREFTILGAYAGLRACEIAQASMDSVESYPGGWRLRVTGKGAHQGIVPCHWRVLEVLREWPKPLGVSADGVSSTVRREFRRLGIPGGVHRARHTFATNALIASNDLLVVRDLMRHASVVTTQAYTQLASDRPAEVVSMLA